MEVIIIGGLHHNTLGVIRSIGERIQINKIIVLIVSDKPANKNLISASKYVLKGNIYYVDRYQDVVPWLKKYMEDKVQRIVISCADGVSLEIISHKTELLKFYRMPDTQINIIDLMSKNTQAKYALESGLCVPEGIILKNGEYPEWNCFPCIVKPENSTIGAGKADIHVVRSKEELIEVVANTQAELIQIQKLINKKLEYQLIGCSFDAGDKILIPGYTEIIRQPENTNTGYLKYSPIDKLSYNKKAVESFIKRIGYSGLFSVEFIRDDDGKDYFLEINMRNDGNAYCVKTAGVNLPYMWYYYCANKKFPEGEPFSFTETIMFIPDLNDFMRGIKQVGLFGWTCQFVKAESHSVWDIHDIGPFMVQIWTYIKIAVKRLINLE